MLLHVQELLKLQNYEKHFPFALQSHWLVVGDLLILVMESEYAEDYVQGLGRGTKSINMSDIMVYLVMFSNNN